MCLNVDTLRRSDLGENARSGPKRLPAGKQFRRGFFFTLEYPSTEWIEVNSIKALLPRYALGIRLASSQKGGSIPQIRSELPLKTTSKLAGHQSAGGSK